MKAVNLIPAEERRSAAGPLAGASGPTLGLLAALVLALIVVFAWVSLSNRVAERRDAVAAARARADAIEAQARALEPYGDVIELRDRTAGAVRRLAAARFDWPGLMDGLSRRVPADVTLVSVGGAATTGDDAATGAPPGDPADPAATAVAGPTIDISGCTTDHRAVARLMDSLGELPGVAEVVLASSTKGESSDRGSGGCPGADQFDLSLTMGSLG